MAIEHLGGQPIETSSDIELPRSAKLYTIRSDQIHVASKPELHDIGMDFLNELVGEDSFRMRFGTPKPNADKLARLVDHFLSDQSYPHTLLLLMLRKHLLGACSIYPHRLRSTPGSDIIDTNHVVEFSATIADELQGQGLGKLLLTRARDHAVANGSTHAYFGFEPANQASRHVVDHVFGSDNLVAGATNPRDKYYRLIVPPADDYAILEQAMRSYCDSKQTEPIQILDDANIMTRFSRTNFGRRIIQVLDTIEVSLPENLRL